MDARHGAEYMLQWCSHDNNLPDLLNFCDYLLEKLNDALVDPTGKVLQRAKIWESYFYIRSQETFINLWTIFLNAANSPVGTPVLYQHITDLIFEELLQEKYVVSASASKGSIASVTHDEANTMRYVAGYMCRHLRKKIEASSHPLKEEMVLCLMTMVKDKDDTCSGPCEEWNDLVDIGGAYGMCVKTLIHFSCVLKKRYDSCFHPYYMKQIKKINSLILLYPMTTFCSTGRLLVLTLKRMISKSIPTC